MFEKATNKLIEAWCERMERAAHIQVEWKETITHKQGTIRSANWVEGKVGATPEVLKRGIPHEDIEFKNLKRSLKISDSMMRIESQQLSIVDPMNLRYEDWIASNNGEYSRSIISSFDGSSVYGIINHESQNISAKTVSLSAVMTAYRASNLDFVISDDPIIEGRESDGTFVVKWGKERVWVDPDRDFFPVRFERYRKRKGQVRACVDIDSANSDGRWELTGWKYIKFDGYPNYESMAEIRYSKVTSITFEPTSPSDFDLVFEKGTRVSKRREAGIWIAEDGGKLRPVD